MEPMARHRSAVTYERLTSRSSATTAPCARPRGTRRSTRVADRLLPTPSHAHGPDAVGFFSCSKSTNEANYLAQKLVRAGHRHQQHRLLQPHLTRSSVVGLATIFGLGGGTSSYREIEDADVIVLWGSNAREAHPIFFHHVLKAVHRGARLFVVDPRRTSTARCADPWLGLDIGTDIALSNTIAREIIHAGLVHERFVARATTGFDEYAASVEPWTLERGEMETGVPAETIRELAHAYATADKAQLCWTLGITEHHNAVDNVLALINLALLTGHVGREGSGLNPLRGQNNVQGGGDMGAIPNKLPGLPGHRRRRGPRPAFERGLGLHPPGHATACTSRRCSRRWIAATSGRSTCMGENPAQSEADVVHARHLLDGLDLLVVQDLFLTRPPSSPTWCCRRPRRGARATAPSPTASAGCSGCARRSSRRATPATTSGSSSRSPAASATTGPTPAPRACGTSCARSRRCTGA